jgi:hypothetical protein
MRYLILLVLLLITAGCIEQQAPITIDRSVHPPSEVTMGCNGSVIDYHVPAGYLPGYRYHTEEADLTIHGKRTTYTILWAVLEKDQGKRVMVSYFEGRCL